MIREPKTDRLLGLTIVGAGYSAFALLTDGNTLDTEVFDKFRHDFTASEPHFLLATVVVLLLSIAALATHGVARILALIPVTAAWVILGVELWRALPGALIPGYTLVMALCAGVAFFDAVRDWTHQ